MWVMIHQIIWLESYTNLAGETNSYLSISHKYLLLRTPGMSGKLKVYTLRNQSNFSVQEAGSVISFLSGMWPWTSHCNPQLSHHDSEDQVLEKVVLSMSPPTFIFSFRALNIKMWTKGYRKCTIFLIWILTGWCSSLVQLQTLFENEKKQINKEKSPYFSAFSL